MTEINEISLPHMETDYINNCKISKQLIMIEEPLRKDLKFMTIPQKNISILVDMGTKNADLMDVKFTYWDRIVMDAVYTLYVHGQDVFTPEMVMRVMTGNLQADASRKKLEKIDETLNNLSYIRIRIDCTEEMIARKIIKKGQTYIKETYLLPLERDEIRSGNHQKIMSGYRLLQKPALYDYAEKVRQFITVPIKIMANSHKTISDSIDVIQIKRYLIMRIEEMKHSGNGMHSDIISYHWYDAKKKKTKGMFPTLGYSDAISPGKKGRKLRSNIHSKVLRILDYYKEIDYIDDYEIVYEGRQKIKGVRIKLSTQDKE